tara:strand:+ start:118 stop:561 length:444 start_codon:yes stop_codon:yes gene_type:complete
MIKTNLNNIVKAVLNVSEQTDRQGIVRSYTMENFADNLCYWVRNRQNYLKQRHDKMQFDLQGLRRSRKEGAPHFDPEEIPKAVDELKWVKEQYVDAKSLQKPIDTFYRDVCGKDYIPRPKPTPKVAKAISDAQIEEAIEQALEPLAA